MKVVQPFILPNLPLPINTKQMDSNFHLHLARLLSYNGIVSNGLESEFMAGIIDPRPLLSCLS
jgi:hypothetical protein